MIVGLAVLVLAPLFLAGGVVVVVVGLLAGCAVLAVVACTRRPRGLPPMVVVVPVVLTYPMPVADWPQSPQLGWQPQPQPQIEDCPTATPSDWEAWSAEIARRCGSNDPVQGA